MATAKVNTDTSSRELVFNRLINASRERVFEAFTVPEQVIKWWGPNGFTNTIHEMEVKPGGAWSFMMHGPDGRDYPNKIVFIEVVKPERLVFKHTGDDDTEGVTHYSTVTFQEVNGKTNLTMKLVFNTAEERERVVKEYGAEEGGKQTIGRLEEYLATGNVKI